MASINSPTYPKVDNQLDQLARLVFYFPNPDGPEAAPFVRTCPFFENPTIKESRSSNLVKYQPIGRAGTLFGYTGAKSRSFTVDFHLTLPNLLQLSRNAASTRIPSNLTKEEQKNQFFTDTGGDAFEKQRNEFSVRNMQNRWRKQQIEADEAGFEKLISMYGANAGFPGSHISDSDKQYNDAVSTIVYWANLIRSSVLTYSQVPSVGPPIIRLTKGVLYQDIPTVAEKYSFTVDDRSGYCPTTLLPRRFNISLTLEEVRANAGTSFAANEFVNRDQLKGWEAVIARHEGKEDSIDPGRPILGGNL